MCRLVEESIRNKTVFATQVHAVYVEKQLPFVHHYGVEFAMLVDIAARSGVDVIAQCDLDTRTHVHQPLQALGRMSSEILHVALQRLAEQDRLVLTDAPSPTLLQPERTGDVISSQEHVATTAQRPPLARHLDTKRT